jgi:fibronectin-binding autotransporter adhesin
VNVRNLTLGTLIELEPQSGAIGTGQTISAPTVFTANGTLTNNVIITKVFGFFSDQVTGIVSAPNLNQLGVSITNNSGMALTPGIASGAGTFTTLTNPLGGILTAVSVTNGASVNGGIINAGFIGVPGTAAKTGILVSGGELSQPITNTGTIAGTLAAIDLSNATASTTINQNAGSIVGAIKLSQHADVLNINGGMIQGDIIGLSDTNIVNIAPTNDANDTFTYGNTISGPLNVSLAAGANLALTAHGTIAAQTLTLAPTSRITGNGAVTPGFTFLNLTNNTTSGNFPTINANKIQPGNLVVNLVGNFPANGTQDFAKVFVASGSLITPLSVQVAQSVDGVPDHVTAQLVQSGNSADLILTEGGGGVFANLPGLTANEASVAAALDSILTNSPNSPVAQVIETALLQLTTTQDKINAVDFLTGEVYSERISAALNGATLTQDLILERLDNEITNATSLGVASNATGAYAADLPSGKGPHLAPVAVRMYEPRKFDLWGEGIGDFGHVNGNGNAASISTATGGFVLGGDVSARSFLGGDWRFGLAGGYTYDHVSVSRLLSTSNVESVFGGVYAGASFGSIQVRAGALYGTNDSSNSRQVRFPGFFEALSSSNGGSIAQGFGEVGYRISLDGLSLGAAPLSRASIEPFAGAAAFLIHENGFTEEGGVAALTGFARDFNIQTTTLGVHGRLAFASTPLSINTTLAWRHAYGDVVPSVLLSFAGTGQNFSISGVPIDRDTFVAEAGVEYAISPAMKVGLSYSGQFGQRATENAFKGNFDWRF